MMERKEGLVEGASDGISENDVHKVPWGVPAIRRGTQRNER